MIESSSGAPVERPEPPRPLPDRRPAEVVAAWWAWAGPVRLITSAVCVAVVVAGGWWLVRAPAPATEARLPSTAASADVSTPVPVTLPPPVTRPAEAVDVAERVVVHVAGGVRVPGVYAFEAAPRVNDAIERAGGATADADLDALNLAQALADGQRVYVPTIGEVEPATVLAPQPVVPAAEGATEAAAGPIDVNRATAVELEQLPGVGPATAAAIIDDRDRNGPFATVDDLDRVPGIGPAKLAALRDLVTV